jgi:hypothetical protein
MKPAGLFLALISIAALGDELVGRIERLAGSAISVDNGYQSLKVYVDDKTEVIQGKAVRNLLPLAAGDEVRIEFHQEPSGKIVATTIYTSVTVSGVVTESHPDSFKILTGPKGADARTIRLDRNTVFGVNRKYLTPNCDVHVVGWDLGDGSILAARVAVYGTDLPERGPRPLR